MYKNKYNELGQLVEQNIHSLDESNFLQSVDYSYNSRGWLKSINQSNLDNSHYYIDLDQYLTADEAVDGMRIDTIQLSIEQDGKDPGIFNFDFRDDKDIKIIDIDSSYIYRYQQVDEHSLVQIKQSSIDTNIFDNLTDLSGRTLFLEFHDLYFSSSDEQEMILDSLSSLINPELASAGIENPDMVAFLKSQIISHFLKSISIIYFNEDQDDLFGEDMYYDENGAATGLGSTPCYNGNISAIKWQTTQNPGSRSYRFQYNDLNQLVDANYAELEGGSWAKNLGRYDEADFTYDHNGNILTLNRYGLNGIQGGINTFGQMDGLTYSYDGNKLKAVEDNIANSGTNNNDFKDNNSHETVEYEYDNNGNLQVDDNKGILSVTYNHLNLPVEIIFSQTKKITYLYAADGRKLRETITDGAMTHTFDYCGNLVYEDGELSYLLTPGGRAIPTEQAHEYVYEYFLKDHLGNVRVVYGDPDSDNEAEVIQENHYYPFGMTLGGLNYVAGLENRYLYQGKEITGDFGLWWQDFHARRFDSQLGRWHVPDPAGQFASPYIGMGNNPINSVDPSGTLNFGWTNRWHCGIQWDAGSIFQRQLDIFYGRTGAPLDDFDNNFILGSNEGAPSRCGGMGNPGNPYENNRDVLAGYDPKTGQQYIATTNPETNSVGIEYKRINPFPGFVAINDQIHFFSLGIEVEDIWVNLTENTKGEKENFLKDIADITGWVSTIRTGEDIYWNSLSKGQQQKLAYDIQKSLKSDGVRMYTKEIKAGINSRMFNYKLGAASGLLIATDIAISGEVRPSHVVSGIMTGIGLTGWGSPIAAGYFLIDLGMGLFYDGGLSGYVDDQWGVPLYDF